VIGSLEAIQHELEKFKSDRIIIRVVKATVGDVTASDVQNISATENAIVVGFNVKVERGAKELAERHGVEIETFTVIYDLAEWLETILKNKTPKQEEMLVTGKAKILKKFSSQKTKHVIGGRVDEGSLSVGQHVQILRRDERLGDGIIKNIQQHKTDVKSSTEGEFGMQIDSKYSIAPGDRIEAYDIVIN